MNQENTPNTEQQPPSSGTGNSANTANLALLTALSPLVSILTGGILFNILIPLILWLVWKDQNPRVDKVGKNVLNSQISWLIWNLIAGIISGILMFIFIGFITIFIVPVLWIIFSIVHALKVSNGEDDYVMPVTIRFLK